MSMLKQLFKRSLLGVKCKACLKLVIARIKLIQNERDVNLKLMRKEIAQYLRSGQQARARIWAAHFIKEQNIQAAYDILELFCELLLVRVPVLEIQKECPLDLREAIASIVFAAPSCTDLPELMQIRNYFGAKYGREFVYMMGLAASELGPDSSVNISLVEKLSCSAPSAEARLELLKQIADEHYVDWDSSKTEAEFRKNHEDLLSGTKQMSIPTSHAESPIKQAPVEQASPTNGVDKGSSSNGSQGTKYAQTPFLRNASLPKPNEIQPSVTPKPISGENRIEPKPRPSDVLNMVQAAIASAERACAEARAALALLAVEYGLQNNDIRVAKSS